MANSGVRDIDGVMVLPLDGLWERLEGAAPADRLSLGLEYAGCEFYDYEGLLVKNSSVSLAGIGGLPVASVADSDDSIKARLSDWVDLSREMMASSAAFSYLNSGDKDLPVLYGDVAGLGHFSMAHTVSANIILAGISEAAELEISLQRDLVHISKVTNARTKVQTNPPIVVHDPDHLEVVSAARDFIAKLVADRVEAATQDDLEALNSLFPTSKATMLMVSGDVSNLQKFSRLKDDRGKEKELRAAADEVGNLLGRLWPELISENQA